jgi:glycosyltransferase involved in cell wall biosynthesis
MHVTVAVCTWNRSALLQQTLMQMTMLRAPVDATWELVLVDNNSTDDTAAVARSFSDRLPLRYLHESTPGKSHALNLATREAAGEYVLWTDDDVLVDPSWLRAYVDAFRRHPSAGFFGGPIRPWFASPSPDWLHRAFEHVKPAYATIDCDPPETRVTGEQVPFGANLAVRLADQRAFPYDPSLGPRPGSAVRNEEIEMIRRMIARGVEGWWVPEAAVRHYIPRARQSVAYLRGYYMGWGEYLALTTEAHGVPQLLGRPRWLWRSAVEHEIRYRVGRLFQQPEQWVASLRAASTAWGSLGLSSLWRVQR